MYRSSVWLVRGALIHFVIGSSVGALMLASQGGLGSPLVMSLRPLHAEMLLVGWMLQLAFGVASWVLPFGRGVDSDWQLYAVLGLLNAGVALVAFSLFWSGDGWLPLFGRVAEGSATLLFGRHIWPRVRGLPQRSEH